MSLSKTIREALLPMGFPVANQVYTGTETTYIVFSRYNEGAALVADDKEQETRFSIQVSAFGKGDIENLIKEVKTRLEAIGFVRNSYFEAYEKDTKLYHKAYRFYYDNKIGE